MRCDACETENRADRKFCRECGTTLAPTCPTCGAANEAGDKFCGNCGSSLDGESARVPGADRASEAEVRLVSVLFADLVGYTSLSETKDSEDIRDLLTAYFDRSREIIERFGGTVDKFIGDAVMGMWGATQVREDDAERAVRASLELVDMVAAMGEELGIDGLTLRAGVNSGTTSVGSGGNERGLIVGDLVNVASRLQSLAEPGAVFVGAATHDASVGAIDYLALGERSVKGKSDPVVAYRAVRVSGMLGASGGADVRKPPFVDREREMRLLKDTLAAVESENRGHLVSIVGEGGIGKSRLAEEFQNYIDGLADDIYWHEGRSPSYGEGVTFWALGEMVRRRCGIREGDDPAAERTRLRTTVAEYVSTADDRVFIEPRLAGLLGLAEMPPGGRSELFSALRLFFQHIAAVGPTVLVFEDLHWADAGLLEFIAELVERSTRSPLLVVTLARPDLLERVPRWGSQLRATTSVRLGPMTRDDLAAMLAEYVPGVDEQVIGLIAERAAGFPLYAVEMVRALSTSGELETVGGEFRFTGDPDEVSLPESLQAVIGARLDRLESGDRALLQDAAVLGQSFPLESMMVLRAGDADEVASGLQRLMQLEILDIEDDPRSPERGQYTFVQSLIREVAYRRLSRQDRRAKHLALATHFARHEDPELAGFVAAHYMGAYEATPDGPEREAMVDKALAVLTAAAARAASFHSSRQAMDLLDQAIALTDDPVRQAGLRLEAIRPARSAAALDRGVAYADAAREYYERVGDIAGVRAATAGRADLFNSSRRADEALAAIGPVYLEMQAVDTVEDVAVAAEAARAYMLVGRSDESLRAVDRMLDTAADLGQTELILEGLTTKATALAQAGRSVEARVLFAGVIEEAERHGLVFSAARSLNNLIAVSIDLASFEELQGLGYRLIELCERAGLYAWTDQVVADTAEACIDVAAYEEASSLLDSRDPATLSPDVGIQFEANRGSIGWMQDGSFESLGQAIAAFAHFDVETDPQWRERWDGAKAKLYTAAGDWENAFATGMSREGTFSSLGFQQALFAAAWLGDVGKVEQVEAAIAAARHTVEGLDSYAAGVRLALQGEHDEATVLLSDVVESWSTAGYDDLVPRLRVVFSLLLRHHDDAAAEAGRSVREWLVATGSMGLLEAWGAALPTETTLAETAG